MKSTIQKLRSMISVIAISLILSSFTTSTARVETSFGTTIMGVPSGSKTFTFWGNNFKELKQIGPDALIISDPGMFTIAKG